MKKIRQLHSAVAWENKFGQMINDHVEGPDGDRAEYGYWKPKMRGIVVVPRRGDRYGIVRVDRYPIAAESLEVPRGMVEPGEELEAAAVRELKEETGYVAESCRLFGQLWPDSGSLAITLSLAVADVTHREEKQQDALESIGELSWKSRGEIEAMVASGEMKCAITIATLTMLWAKG